MENFLVGRHDSGQDAAQRGLLAAFGDEVVRAQSDAPLQVEGRLTSVIPNGVVDDAGMVEALQKVGVVREFPQGGIDDRTPPFLGQIMADMNAAGTPGILREAADLRSQRRGLSALQRGREYAGRRRRAAGGREGRSSQ